MFGRSALGHTRDFYVHTLDEASGQTNVGIIFRGSRPSRADELGTTC